MLGFHTNRFTVNVGGISTEIEIQESKSESWNTVTSHSIYCSIKWERNNRVKEILAILKAKERPERKKLQEKKLKNFLNAPKCVHV